MTNHTPQQYYTRPIPVEAFKLEEDNLSAVARWCSGSVKGLSVQFPKIRDRTKILNPEDTKSHAIIGEYIVRTKKGFVLMRPDEFNRKFASGVKRV